jgi:hypothetical protein
LELGHQENVDASPNFLKDSNVNLKVKTIEEKCGIFLSSQHFRGKKGHAGAPRWGLG